MKLTLEMQKILFEQIVSVLTHIRKIERQCQLSFDIIQYQRMGERISNNSFCKNHPSVPSGYFISDKPWVKYCRDCALNVALSGHRIEKELSPEEFQRKLHINSAVSELRAALPQLDQTALHYRRLTDALEEVGGPLTAHIADVEAAMKALAQSKERLEELYAREVAEKAQTYYEKQSRVALLTEQVKRELEAIESSFGNLIELQDQGGFEEQQQRWKGLLDSYKKEAFTEQDYALSKANIFTSVEEFYNHLESISRFSIDVRPERRPSCGAEELDLVLTPIDGNSLAETVTFDQLRLALKARGPLKLKTHKRGDLSLSKTLSKRSSPTDSHLQTIRRA